MKLPTICPTLVLCAMLGTIFSCTEPRDTDIKPQSTTVDSTSTGTPALPAANSIDACALAVSLPQSLDTIRQSAPRVLAAPDSCVLRLVDSLAAMGRNGATPALLVVIDSLYSASDGYASEAVATILPGIFRQSPETVARYLVDTRDRKAETLRSALVQGLGLERATLLTPDADLERDRNLFQKVLRGTDLSPDERSFLDSLMNESLSPTTPN